MSVECGVGSVGNGLRAVPKPTVPNMQGGYMSTGQFRCLRIRVDAERNKNRCHCGGHRPVAIRIPMQYPLT